MNRILYILFFLALFVVSGCLDPLADDPFVDDAEYIAPEPMMYGSLWGFLNVHSLIGADCLYHNCSTQGMAIHGDYAFVFSNKGWCRVYNLKRKTLVCQTALESFSDDNHANTAAFGPLSAFESDRFPLLYVSECNGKGRCFVERFDGTEFHLHQTITCWFRATDWFVDGDNKRLFALATKEQSGMSVYAFPLPDPSAPEVFLTEEDSLGKWEYGFDYQHIVQGGVCGRGNLMIAYGYPFTKRGIHVIDLFSGELVEMDLSGVLNDEPEDVDFYADKLLMVCNSGNGIYEIMKLLP